MESLHSATTVESRMSEYKVRLVLMHRDLRWNEMVQKHLRNLRHLTVGVSKDYQRSLLLCLDGDFEIAVGISGPLWAQTGDCGEEEVRNQAKLRLFDVALLKKKESRRNRDLCRLQLPPQVSSCFEVILM